MYNIAHLLILYTLIFMKHEKEKQSGRYQLRISPEFLAELKAEAPRLGLSVGAILREGAKMLIADSHQKARESKPDTNAD